MNNAGSVLNSALLNPAMASFTAQAALRAKWSSLVEDHSIDVPAEVTNKVTSVVGWLKQVYPFKLCVCLYTVCMSYCLTLTFSDFILQGM